MVALYSFQKKQRHIMIITGINEMNCLRWYISHFSLDFEASFIIQIAVCTLNI